MIPVDFEGCNARLIKPESMTDEECGDCPMQREQLKTGAFTHLVKWRLSDLDIINLQNNSLIIAELTCDYPVFMAMDTRKIPADAPQYTVLHNVIGYSISYKQLNHIRNNRTLWIRLTGAGFPPMKVYTKLPNEIKN